MPEIMKLHLNLSKLCLEYCSRIFLVMVYTFDKTQRHQIYSNDDWLVAISQHAQHSRKRNTASCNAHKFNFFPTVDYNYSKI